MFYESAVFMKKSFVCLCFSVFLLFAFCCVSFADENSTLTFFKMHFYYLYDEGNFIEYRNFSDDEISVFSKADSGSSKGVFYSCYDLPKTDYIVSNEYAYKILEDNTIALLAIDPAYQTRTLKIPEQIDGFTVTHIGLDSRTGTKWNGEYFLSSKVKRIILPASLKVIGPGVFSTALKEVVIPEGVTDLGSLNILGLDSVRKLKLPKRSLKTLDDFALAGTRNKNWILPAGLTTLGAFAFLRSSAKSVVIPSSVMVIGDYTFLECSSLTKVTLQEGIPYLSNGMFAKCAKLRSITIPESVLLIGKNAFMDCNKLSKVKFAGNQIEDIPEGAFRECESLEKIVIPEGVKSIGKDAFLGCRKLKSVRIPETVTSIDISSFSNCHFKLTFIVKKDSYAEEWAKVNNIFIKYVDK